MMRASLITAHCWHEESAYARGADLGASTMRRKAEAISQHDGYTIVEASAIAKDGSVARTWIEVECPNGDHKLCHGIEDAEAFIDARLERSRSK